MNATVAHGHETHPAHQGLPPPPRGWRRLLYPGFIRATWMTGLFFGIGLIAGYPRFVRWNERRMDQAERANQPGGTIEPDT